MLDPQLCEWLEFIARKIRKDRRGAPFGGIQVLLCGDFLQLPPVELDGAAIGQWAFCFQTPAWRKCGLQTGSVILRQPHRQQGDPLFVQVLNEVRAGRWSPQLATKKVLREVVPMEDRPEKTPETNERGKGVEEAEKAPAPAEPALKKPPLGGAFARCREAGEAGAQAGGGAQRCLIDARAPNQETAQDVPEEAPCE